MNRTRPLDAAQSLFGRLNSLIPIAGLLVAFGSGCTPQADAASAKDASEEEATSKQGSGRRASSKRRGDGSKAAASNDEGVSGEKKASKKNRNRRFFKAKKIAKKQKKAKKAKAQSGESPPNVIIIVSDDVGYREHGFMGSKVDKTPHLDALAASGVKFTSGYASSSVCSPSRAGLLTGRYQQRFGVEDNQGSDIPGEDGTTDGLPLTEKTLADSFRGAGYQTVALGKWHLGQSEGQHPLDRGFDHFFGLWGGSRPYFPTKDLPNEKKLMVDREYYGENFDYLTDALGDAAVEFIEDVEGEPFFMYLSPTAAHGPIEAPKAQEAKFPNLKGQAKTRAAMVASLDDMVGKVISKLEEQGTRKNTIILYLSDNGGKTGLGANNAPLRDGKGSLMEGGSRVPMVISYPKSIPGGQTFDAPMSALDFAPTALSLAQVATQPLELDGINMMPFLAKGKKAYPERAIFHRRRFLPSGLGKSWVRKGPWKLIRHKKNWLLYDVVQDPGESKELSVQHPQIVADLQATLAAWEKELPAYDPERQKVKDKSKKKK